MNSVRPGQSLSEVAHPWKAGPLESKPCLIHTFHATFALLSSPAAVPRGLPRRRCLRHVCQRDRHQGPSWWPRTAPPPLTVACRAGDGADPPRRRLSASPLPQGTLGGVAARSATHKGLSAHRGARRPPPPGRSATIVFPCGTHVGPPRPTCHLFFPRPTRPPPPPDAPASVRVCAFTVASSLPRGGGQHGRHVQRGQHGRA